jgi:hypothetical protein
MKLSLILLVITAIYGLLGIPLLAAEFKTIISESTYTMGDGESPALAEAMVLQKAKRQALEEAGTYVLSYSKTQNMDLTQDEVLTVAGGLLKTEILEQKRHLIGNALNLFVKIKAQISVVGLEEIANRSRTAGLDKQYSALRRAFTEADNELVAAQERLSQARSLDERTKTLSDIASQSLNLLDLNAREEELFSRLVPGKSLARDAATPFQVLEQAINKIMRSGLAVHVGEPKVKPTFTNSDHVELLVPISFGIVSDLPNQLTSTFSGLGMLVRPVGVVARRFGDYKDLPRSFIGASKLSIFKGTQVFLHDDGASRYVSSRISELRLFVELFQDDKQIAFCTTDDLRVPPVVMPDELWQISDWRKLVAPENMPPCRTANCDHDHLIALSLETSKEFWNKVGYPAALASGGKLVFQGKTLASIVQPLDRPRSLVIIEDKLDKRTVHVRLNMNRVEKMTSISARLVETVRLPSSEFDSNCRIELGIDAESFK